MAVDPERLWQADKVLSIEPDWKRRGQEEFARLVSPLDIDGITVQGLRFTASAHIHSAESAIAFQIEVETPASPRGTPIARFDWKPRAPHNNRGIGPPAFRHRPFHESHVHPFDLNWLEAEARMRSGNLPVAIPVAEPVESYADALDFSERYFRIKGVSSLLPPPWTRRE